MFVALRAPTVPALPLKSSKYWNESTRESDVADTASTVTQPTTPTDGVSTTASVGVPLTSVAATPLNRNVVPASNVPVSVTSVPPAFGPKSGSTSVSTICTGGGGVVPPPAVPGPVGGVPGNVVP